LIASLSWKISTNIVLSNFEDEPRVNKLLVGDMIMASMLVQQRVRDFSEWKRVYDSAADLRTSFGGLSDQIYRDVSDPNFLTVILEWDSMEKAQEYSQSPELKAAMEKAGVEGPPEIHFLNEA
jgi:quinol monooxygenase YgiN